MVNIDRKIPSRLEVGALSLAILELRAEGVAKADLLRQFAYGQIDRGECVVENPDDIGFGLSYQFLVDRQQHGVKTAKLGKPNVPARREDNNFLVYIIKKNPLSSDIPLTGGDQSNIRPAEADRSKTDPLP